MLTVRSVVFRKIEYESVSLITMINIDIIFFSAKEALISYKNQEILLA